MSETLLPLLTAIENQLNTSYKSNHSSISQDWNPLIPAFSFSDQPLKLVELSKDSSVKNDELICNRTWYLAFSSTYVAPF
jgi:hypothetical protein